LQAVMAVSGIPNLWKPANDAYLKVDIIPILGTGKTDLKGIKMLAATALERSGNE
jgi:acyl-[acyl-carrier-protein]-phospholipid O-acyltransferase/long-chain-fatty-acid--[acyl-carrier-protein] ligase